MWFVKPWQIYFWYIRLMFSIPAIVYVVAIPRALGKNAWLLFILIVSSFDIQTLLSWKNVPLSKIVRITSVPNYWLQIQNL